MSVSKNNHVDRDYEITVNGNRTVDVMIHPIGDINGDGKTNTRDFGMAYAHAQKLKDSELTGCALTLSETTAKSPAPTPRVSTLICKRQITCIDKF